MEELTALNDLAIGNVTVKMGWLSLMNAIKGSVPFVSPTGVVVTNDKLKFTKNTLQVPALKVERIASDVDLKGNTLQVESSSQIAIAVFSFIHEY